MRKQYPEDALFIGNFKSPLMDALKKADAIRSQEGHPEARHLTAEEQEIVNTSLEKIRKILSRALDATQTALDDICLDFHSSPETRLRYVKTLVAALNAIGPEITYTLGNYTGKRTHVWKAMAEDPTLSKDYNIWVEGDRVTIQMPTLPSRYAGNDDPFNQMFAAKVSACPNFPKWSSWHATFFHVHPVKGNGQSLRDVDNFDYKKTIDIIATAMHTSDSAHRFDMSMTTVFTDDYTPGVYIEIIPKSEKNTILPTPLAIHPKD